MDFFPSLGIICIKALAITPLDSCFILNGILLQNISCLFPFFFFSKSNKLQGIVVVEKTQMSEQYFPAVQKFTVLDLGMVLLPVASQMEASCLIIQLVSTHSYSSTVALV